MFPKNSHIQFLSSAALGKRWREESTFSTKTTVAVASCGRNGSSSRLYDTMGDISMLLHSPNGHQNFIRPSSRCGCVEQIMSQDMLSAAFSHAFLCSIHLRTATASLVQLRPFFSSNICISMFVELRRAIESFLNVFGRCFISTPWILSKLTLVTSYPVSRRPWCSHSLKSHRNYAKVRACVLLSLVGRPARRPYPQSTNLLHSCHTELKGLTGRWVR